MKYVLWSLFVLFCAMIYYSMINSNLTLVWPLVLDGCWDIQEVSKSLEMARLLVDPLLVTCPRHPSDTIFYGLFVKEDTYPCVCSLAIFISTASTFQQGEQWYTKHPSSHSSEHLSKLFYFKPGFFFSLIASLSKLLLSSN